MDTKGKLGKLSLALLESFVKKNVGEDFITELKSKYKTQETLVLALDRTEKRFISEFTDKDLSKAMFIDPSQKDRPELDKVARSFFEQPTNSLFASALQDVLLSDFPNVTGDRAQKAILAYVEILTEELALLDDEFRQRISALAEIRSSRIFSRIERAFDDEKRLSAVNQSLSANTPHQLPSPPVDFVGRQAELQEIINRIQGRENVSVGVQGMGGAGKTALALKFADAMQSLYPDGQYFLDLHGSDRQVPVTPEQAMKHVLFFLNPTQVLPDNEQQLRGVYYSSIANKRILFLWDNVRDFAQIQFLLHGKNCLHIFTSRNRIDAPGLERFDIGALNILDSQELIRNIIPDTPADACQRIGELCGYLPLAIRIACSSLRIRPDWNVQLLIEKLQREADRLDYLVSRQDTNISVEASLEVSYQLLSDELKKSFRKLGVFVAPFPKNAAAAALGKIELEGQNLRLLSLDEKSVDNLLGGLLFVNLLDFDPVAKIYKLHSLTQIFAEKCLLGDSLEASSAIESMAIYNLLAIQNVWKEYAKGGDHVFYGVLYLRTLLPHLRFVFERFRADSNFGWLRSSYADFWLSTIFIDCVDVLKWQLSPAELIELLNISLEASRKRNDLRGQEIHLGNLADAYARNGEFTRSIACAENAILVSHSIKDYRNECKQLSFLAIAHLSAGNLIKGEEIIRRALQVSINLNDHELIFQHVVLLGYVLVLINKKSNEIRNISGYLELMLSNMPIGIKHAISCWVVGGLYNLEEDKKNALRFYEQSLELFDKYQNQIRNLSGAYQLVALLLTQSTVYLALADLYEGSDTPEKAIPYLEKALEDVEDNEQVFSNVSTTNPLLSEARPYFSKDSLLGRLGYVYAVVGDKEKALKCVEEIKSKELVNFFAWAEIGNILSAIDEDNEAVYAYTQSIVNAPREGDPNGWLYRNRADAYIALRKWDLAKADIETAEQLEPEHPYLFLRKGDLNFWQRDFSQAVKYYRGALAKLDNSEWYYGLGFALLGMQDETEATKAIEIGLTRNTTQSTKLFLRDVDKIKTILPAPDLADKLILKMQSSLDKTTSKS